MGRMFFGQLRPRLAPGGIDGGALGCRCGPSDSDTADDCLAGYPGGKRVGRAGPLSEGGGFQPFAAGVVEALDEHADMAAAALCDERAEGIVLLKIAEVAVEEAAGLVDEEKFEIAAADRAVRLCRCDEHTGAGFARGRAFGRGEGDHGDGLARENFERKVGPVVHAGAPRTPLIAASTRSGVAGASSFGALLWPPTAAIAS